MKKRELLSLTGVLVCLLLLTITLTAKTIAVDGWAHAVWTDGQGPKVPVGTELEVDIVVDYCPEEYHAEYSSTNLTKSGVGKHNLGTTVSFIYDGDKDDEPNFEDIVYLEGAIIEVDKIEITAEGKQNDVTGQTIVVLKGSKYSFKAIPNPTDKGWPEEKATWTGIGSSGEIDIECEFNEEGTFSLNGKCGDNDIGKTVTINVVKPEIEELLYSGGQQILDKKNKWVKSKDINDPACYIQGKETTVAIKIKLTKALTYDTDIKFKGNLIVDSHDIFTGGNYEETTATIKKGEVINETPFPITSSGESSKIITDGTIDIDWKYMASNGKVYDNLGKTNDIEFFLILAKEKAGEDFNYNPLKFAMDAINMKPISQNNIKADIDKMRTRINNAIYSKYTYAKNCNSLASNFVIGCQVLGIDAKLIKWENGGNTKDAMRAMEPKAFTGAGGAKVPSSTILLNLGRYSWWNHVWAESGNKTYDPSSGFIGEKTKEEYEDYVIINYARVVKPATITNSVIKSDGEYNWEANQSGQSKGCEPTGSFKNPSLDSWS